MRQAIEVALAFLRIPRFFISLLVVPCVLSLLLIYIQMSVTQRFMKIFSSPPKSAKEVVTRKPEANFLHKLLFDVDGPLPPLQICRWRDVASGSVAPGCSASGEGTPCSLAQIQEVPEDPERCPLGPYDIVVINETDQEPPIEEYAEIFDGNFLRLHLCRECSSNVVISIEKDGTYTHVLSVWGLGLLSMTRYSPKQTERLSAMFDYVERTEKVVGTKMLHIPGLLEPIRLDDFADSLGMIVNFSIVIIVALWLALRAHRRVLDYFSHSGALLPLVAAVGKRTFYGGIWILTLIRVATFLVAAIPLGYWILVETIPHQKISRLFFNGDSAAVSLWLIAILASFCLATLIASISDLKHRRSVMSIFYKYVPLLACLFGGALWALSFLVASDLSRVVREVLASMPLVGMVAILVAPIFSPAHGILVVNTLLTVLITVVIAKANSRWFAAHLDEV